MTESGEVYPLPRPRRLDGPIIQSAVNFSEGRREDVIGEILAAISSEPAAVLADWSADSDHNRMVATLFGDPRAVSIAILAAVAAAVGSIDLREHSGAHPRSGAVDVIPLVPIRGVTIEECVETSVSLGAEIARTHEIPVYLYERSANVGRRTILPEIRKGGFEGLFAEPLTGERAPDFGPAEPHPTAGMVVVGARGQLVAYNVNLATEDTAMARSIAASIRRERATNPDLTGVRALGLSLPSRGLSQVSMNLTLPELAPIPKVFEFVRSKAEEAGVRVTESEVIGLIPRSAMDGAEPDSILWRDYHRRQILENWV